MDHVKFIIVMQRVIFPYVVFLQRMMMACVIRSADS